MKEQGQRGERKMKGKAAIPMNVQAGKACRKRIFEKTLVHCTKINFISSISNVAVSHDTKSCKYLSKTKPGSYREPSKSLLESPNSTLEDFCPMVASFYAAKVELDGYNTSAKSNRTT